jgi:hypothetical protein
MADYPPCKKIIIEILSLLVSAVSAIDTSGVSLFKDLKKAVENKGSVEASAWHLNCLFFFNCLAF